MLIEESTNKTEFVNEPKKKFMPLRKLDLNTAELIKDEWHQAIITYFNLKPKYKGQFSDFPLNATDIENIKRYYGVLPTESYHYFMNQYKKDKKDKIDNTLDLLDFYSQCDSKPSSILECDDDPFIESFDYYNSNSNRNSINSINSLNNVLLHEILEDYW